MSKKVLNNDEIQKKQQKQFSIGLCLGFLLFIIFIIFQESSFFRNKIIVESSLLKTPAIIPSTNKEDKGLELQKLMGDYENFTSEINKLNLGSLEGQEFVKDGNDYKFVNENYTYYTSSSFLKLTRKNETIYMNSYEEGIYKYELFLDIHYVLEYSPSMISFKVNDYVYSIQIKDNHYILSTEYLMNGYKVTSEIYDLQWNFVETTLTYQEVNYNGYFFGFINGYSLSENKLEIINDSNNERIPSTSYKEDSSLYYTIGSYNFSETKSKDLLIVNFNEEFPLK